MQVIRVEIVDRTSLHVSTIYPSPISHDTWLSDGNHGLTKGNHTLPSVPSVPSDDTSKIYHVVHGWLTWFNEWLPYSTLPFV
jgi:hypothetical protein